jgi:hypothetical protein
VVLYPVPVCARASSDRPVAERAFVSAIPLILLQNSKAAGQRISRENKRPGAIADSYSFTSISEVACEFTVRR